MTDDKQLNPVPDDGSHVADLIGHEVVDVMAVDGTLELTFDNGEVLAASFYSGEGCIQREGPDRVVRWWLGW
jgi:hypothetical protein